MKRVLCIIMLLAISLLSGCYQSKDDVPIKDREEMDRYVRKEFGAAECISETVGDYRFDYIYKDKEYGFEYYVNSYVDTTEVDMCTVYSLGFDTNFQELYAECVLNELDEVVKQYEEEYDIEIEFCDKFINEGEFNSIKVTVTDDLHAIITDLGVAIDDVDKRNYFKCVNISDIAQYPAGEDSSAAHSTLGYYSFRSDKYVTREEMQQERIISYVDYQVKREEKPRFLEMEKVRLKDLGIYPEVVVNSSENDYRMFTDDTLIAVYHFKLGFEKFFVADIKVAGNYFTNYDFNKEVED